MEVSIRKHVGSKHSEFSTKQGRYRLLFKQFAKRVSQFKICFFLASYWPVALPTVLVKQGDQVLNYKKRNACIYAIKIPGFLWYLLFLVLLFQNFTLTMGFDAVASVPTVGGFAHFPQIFVDSPACAASLWSANGQVLAPG